MSDKDRNTPPPSRFSRFSKTASFWLLIFLIPVLIIQFASPNRKELQELKYVFQLLQLLTIGARELNNEYGNEEYEQPERSRFGKTAESRWRRRIPVFI